MKTCLNQAMTAAVALGLFFSFQLPVLGAEFSADMVHTIGGMVTKGKIYVKGQKTRTEMENGGVTIMDMGAKKTYVLQPAMQAYFDMSGNMDVDKVQNSEEELAKIAKKERLGSEKVGGIECDKYLITYHDKSMGKITQWHAKKYNYPIKIVYSGSQGEMTTEYQNIKEGGVSDSLFTVPKGYQKMQMPGMGMGAGMGRGRPQD